MRLYKLILILISSLILVMSSCKEDIDGIVETQIDEDMLLGGWEFTGEVKVKIEASFGENIAENLTEKFMKDIAKERKFYFTKKRAYCVWSIDTEKESTKQSEYTCEDYILKFKNSKRFFYYSSVPMFYVKNQTANSMTFYLLKNEIIDLLKDDGSIPNNIISMIKDGICEMPLRRYHNDFWDEIDAIEAIEDEE